MKMRSLIFFIFFLKLTAISQFAFLIGSEGMEYGKANAVDRDNNYINAFLFQNRVNANAYGTHYLDALGAVDIGIAKYNSSGQLLWAKRLGGRLTTEAPHGVDTDSLNNIYVTGYFGSEQSNTNLQADFNPEGGGILVSKGSYDAFLAKYDKDGNFKWAFSLGNTLAATEERAWDICTDNQGNSYITGAFSGSVDFNPLGSAMIKTLNLPLPGLFLAKYNSIGICQWVITVDASIANIFNEGYGAVDLDQKGNVYWAGNFRGLNVNFDQFGTTLLSSLGQTDMFLAQYSENGILNWAKRIGGAQSDIISPGAMRVDSGGNPFFTGRISGNVNFNTSGGVNSIAGSLYLASYDKLGQLKFVMGFPSSDPGDGGHRIGFDSKNNIILSGWVSGRTDFNGDGAYEVDAISPAGVADAFTAKFENNTSYPVLKWINTIGSRSSNGNNICAGLAVDKNDNIYITGQLFGTNADFDPSPYSQLIVSSTGQNDCFVIKYNSDGDLVKQTTSVNKHEFEEKFGLLHNYPNPFNPKTKIEFSVKEREYVSIVVYDLLGREIKTLAKNVYPAGKHSVEFLSGNLNSGIYFYEMRTKDFREIKRMILIK